MQRVSKVGILAKADARNLIRLAGGEECDAAGFKGQDTCVDKNQLLKRVVCSQKLLKV